MAVPALAHCLRLLALLLLILPAACADQTRQLAVLGGAARGLDLDDGNDAVGFSARIQPAVPETRMQCVPFARQVSGVNISGNAATWWRSAEGKYLRGSTPREMAVMVLKSSGSMRLGHVSVVTKVVNAREVLVSHANWGWNAASRARIRHGQRVHDVSEKNDWTSLRFYNEEFGSFGRPYPAHGFIYGPSSQQRQGLTEVALAEPAMQPPPVPITPVNAHALPPDETDDADETTYDPEAVDAGDGNDSDEIGLMLAHAGSADSADPAARFLAPAPPAKPMLTLVSADAADAAPLPPPTHRRRADAPARPRERHDPPPLPPSFGEPMALERRRVVP